MNEPQHEQHGETAGASAGGDPTRTQRGNRRVTPVAERSHAREVTPASPAAPVVIKLGGRALEAPGALHEFAAALARLSRVSLLVHGGGAEVTQWLERAGIEARFAHGLRITDAPTLEIATAVLAGLANKRMVAVLRAHGVDAVGLATLDGGTLTVQPHAQADVLGAVGEVTGNDPTLLELLLAQGRTPVLASIGATQGGALLNLNADDAACAIASAMHASALLLLSDTPGLKLGGSVVREVRASELPALLTHPDVQGGMLPKLRSAQAALGAGVGRVTIASWNGPDTLAALLTGAGAGTTLIADHTCAPTEEAHA